MNSVGSVLANCYQFIANGLDDIVSPETRIGIAALLILALIVAGSLTGFGVPVITGLVVSGLLYVQAFHSKTKPNLGIRDIVGQYQPKIIASNCPSPCA